MKKVTLYTLLCTTMIPDNTLASDPTPDPVTKLREQRNALPTTPLFEKDRKDQLKGQLSPWSIDDQVGREKRDLKQKKVTLDLQIETEEARRKSEQERKEERKQHEAELAKAEADQEAALKQVKEMQDKLTTMGMSMADWQLEKQQLTAERQTLNQKAKSLESDMGELQRKIERREAGFENLVEEARKLSEELQEARRLESTSAIKIEELTERLELTAEKYKQTNDQKLELQSVIRDAQSTADQDSELKHELEPQASQQKLPEPASLDPSPTEDNSSSSEGELDLLAGVDTSLTAKNQAKSQ